MHWLVREINVPASWSCCSKLQWSFALSLQSDHAPGSAVYFVTRGKRGDSLQEAGIEIYRLTTGHFPNSLENILLFYNLYSKNSLSWKDVDTPCICLSPSPTRRLVVGMYNTSLMISVLVQKMRKKVVIVDSCFLISLTFASSQPSHCCIRQFGHKAEWLIWLINSVGVSVVHDGANRSWGKIEKIKKTLQTLLARRKKY